MFEVKTRFRFSSEGGVGEKTRFGGGRFVIGTPSLPSHKPISVFLPSHKPISVSLPSHKPISVFLPSHKHFSFSHLSPITPTYPHNTKKIGLI